MPLPETPAVRAPGRRESILVLALVALLGLVNLPAAFHGDKALYNLGARVLAEGGVLYRDFWDLKKPGIYLFHLGTGTAFGFDELGLHAGELVWLLVLGMLVLLEARRGLRFPRLALLAPLATVGTYVALTDEWHHTQPAILAALPLFLMVRLCLAGRSGGPGAGPAAFGAGVAGTAALLFKDVLLPLVLALAIACYWPAAGVTADERARARGPVLLTLAGLVTGLALVAVWFWRAGALNELLWTVAVFPREALAEHGLRPIARLVDSGRWFVRTFAPLLLAALAAPLGWRGFAAERLWVVQVTWLVIGAATILMEPFAWWQFDTLLLVVPLGLLAVRGVDGLLHAVPSPRRTAVALALAAALLAPAMRHWLGKAREVLPWVLGEEDGHAHRLRVNPRYRGIWAATAFLRADSALPGPIYVFGDPLILHLGRRPQAARIHGWGWEIFLPAQWTQLAAELARERPAYVFLDDEYDALSAAKAPGLRRWLTNGYGVLRRDSMGTWFARH
jgi:hypothetical protein